jgi:hypothetical protein
MQVSRAAAIWLEYHRSHSRDNTLKSYQVALGSFLDEFADRQIGEILTEEILSFLNRVTEGKKPQTRRFGTPTSLPFQLHQEQPWPVVPESMRHPGYAAVFLEQGSRTLEHHRQRHGGRSHLQDSQASEKPHTGTDG